jgi:acyl carrier protein
VSTSTRANLAADATAPSASTGSTPADGDARQALTVILAKHLPARAGTFGVPFDRDLFQLGLDSLSAVRVVLELEETFDVTFPETMINVDLFASAATLERAVSALVTNKA